MARRISPLEYEVRQLVIDKALPYAFAAGQRLSRLATSRFRRTGAIFRHCRGQGIEVGAGAAPSAVPPGSTVRYVDKYDFDRLKGDAELSRFKIPKPDIISSAEKLEAVPDRSQDFVIAFMVMEHVEDPIGMLGSAKRVLKPGGALIVSVPDKRYDVDRDRQVTSWEHFVRDHEQGGQVSREEHFREVALHVQKLRGEELDRFVARAHGSDDHIHFHVWDAASYLSFLQQANAYLGGGLEIVDFSVKDHETLASLRFAGVS